MLNRIVVIGRLTRDPELRSTGSGVAVATFTVAVDRRFPNSRGEKETDFIPVVVWRGLAETCGRYLSKGRQQFRWGQWIYPRFSGRGNDSPG